MVRMTIGMYLNGKLRSIFDVNAPKGWSLRDVIINRNYDISDNKEYRLMGRGYVS